MMPEVEGQWRSLGTVSVLGETLVPITPRLWAAMMTCRTTDQTCSYCISKNLRVYYVLMKFKIDYVAYEHVLWL